MSLKIGRNDPCWCGSGKKYKNPLGAFTSRGFFLLTVFTDLCVFACAFYFLDQVEGESANQSGKISNRPSSIAMDRTNLDKFEYPV